jgi:hypothetical protein
VPVELVGPTRVVGGDRTLEPTVTVERG